MALRRLARLGGALAASTSSSPAPTSSARVAAAATRWMATWQANELRVGALVEKDGAIAEVTKYQYTQGKARQVGCVQVEYRDLRTGASSVEKLSPSDKITRAELVSEVRRASGSRSSPLASSVSRSDGAHSPRISYENRIATPSSRASPAVTPLI